MLHLKESTTITLNVGPFVDKSDGVTEETALTLDVELSKNGGTFANRNSATAITHDASGWYKVELNTTDTNTTGRLIVKAHDAANALPVWIECMVMPANVYDSLYGTDKLDVNVEEWNATAVPAEHTAGYPVVTVKDGTGTGEIDTNAGAIVSVTTVGTTNALGTGAVTAAAIATGAIDADAIATDAVTEIQAGLATSAEVAAVQADTDNIQTRLPAALVGGRMDSSVGAMASSTVTAAALATDAVNEVRDAILSDATPFAGSQIANLDAAVSTRATPADVNAQVLDVLTVDTFAEPGQGVPPATSTILQKLAYLFKAWRNKITQSSTEYRLFADDTTTVDQKAAVSDDGTTLTRGEVASGP